MSEPQSADERTRREEHAERVRDAFRRTPGFLDQLRRAQDDVRTGRLVDQDELQRKYPASDE